MSRCRLLLFVLLWLASCLNFLISVSWAAGPGFGVIFFNNAHPVFSAPPGHSAGDWEWRPLYVNDPEHFAMPAYPTLVGKGNYWFSASAWKSKVSTNCPWTGTSLYCHKTGPSSVWRRYQSTLYYQINNAPVPNPTSVPGYTVQDYYYNRYASSDTVPAQALPANWYLDDFRRMVVESATRSYQGLGSWNKFEDMTHLAGVGAVAGGGLGYVVFLLCEYALVFNYDETVQRLHEQAALYRSYFSPTEHHFFSLHDPTYNKPIIVRRKVPNYSVPSGVDASLSPTRDCPGSFVFSSGEAVSSGSAQATKSKSVTINEIFTTASIPFQFSLEAQDDSASSNSQLSGRFSVRVHAPAAGGLPERWLVCEVAGTPAGQWLAPWGFVAQKNSQAAWSSTADNGAAVSTNFAQGGQNILSINWSGELVIRAIDLGVDRLDKIEFTVATEAQGGMKSTARVCLQPQFSRNIAEAGPWRVVATGAAVNFQAETNALPSNAQTVSYSWEFGDGASATGPNATHAFTQPGVYDVLLRVDPQVPEQAPNKELFNDAQKGVSYDICRVYVGGSPGAAGSTNAALVFSDLRFEAKATSVSAGSVTVSWKTNAPATSHINWRWLPPDFAGPPAPYQAGTVNDNRLLTDHSLTFSMQGSDIFANWPYFPFYIQVGGKLAPNDTAIIWATHDNNDSWWTVRAPKYGAPANVVSLPTSPLTFSNVNFKAGAGQIIATWQTDRPATAQIRCVDSPTATPREASRASYETQHQLTISGLSNDRTYYVTIAGTPQGGAAPVVCMNNGLSYWPVYVPPLSSEGSRSSNLTGVEYALATPEGGGQQYKYQAQLTMPATVRLLRRVLPDGEWQPTPFISGTLQPSWILPTEINKAYEFALEQRTGSGQIFRSRSWTHIAEAPPPPPSQQAVGKPMVAFVVEAADGATIAFPAPLAGTPVILVSATYNGEALAACAIDNRPTKFRLSLRDADNRPIRQRVPVSVVAYVPGAEDKLQKLIQGACQQYGDGASIRFDTPFRTPPVIVCNAQTGGAAVTAAAVNNTTTGFTLSLKNLSGGSVSSAWVQWLAIACPVNVSLPSGSLYIEGQVLQANDGHVASFARRFRQTPPVVCSAQRAIHALLAGPSVCSQTQAQFSLRNHDNQPVDNAWLQWLAVAAP